MMFRYSEMCLEILLEFHKFNWIGPFKNVTIAVARQKYYKIFVLHKEEIAIISPQRYQPNRKTSILATHWLEWENMSANGRIQHRRTRKQAKIGRYFVNGADKQEKTVYEYNRCVFHGHPY